MSLRDFLRAKRDGIEKGMFAIIEDRDIPMDRVLFVGDDNQSAQVTWTGLPDGLGEMIAETIEFLQRKKRIQVVAIAINPGMSLIVKDAISYFCDPDSAQAEIVEDNDDDAQA